MYNMISYAKFAVNANWNVVCYGTLNGNTFLIEEDRWGRYYWHTASEFISMEPEQLRRYCLHGGIGGRTAGSFKSIAAAIENMSPDTDFEAVSDSGTPKAPVNTAPVPATEEHGHDFNVLNDVCIYRYRDKGTPMVALFNDTVISKDEVVDIVWSHRSDGRIAVMTERVFVSVFRGGWPFAKRIPA